MNDQRDPLSSDETLSGSAELDVRLAELLGEMSEAARQGEDVDIEVHCQQYPELADELRELWGMLLVADIAGNDLEATTLMDCQ